MTGYPTSDDRNSYWTVRAQNGRSCRSGDKIGNKDIVRLQHLTTGKYLHSHIVPAPMSQGEHEVSAFEDRGRGDSGDNWRVDTAQGDVWKRGEKVRLVHSDTKRSLATHKRYFQHPIPGQQEVIATASKGTNTYWHTREGIYFPVNA